MTHKRKPLTARAMAVEHLLRIEVDNAFVGLVQKDALLSEADPRTERQATEYVAGVTRWRRYLDFILRRFYKGPFEKMEPVLQQILRVGLYDVLMLETPPHAALHEAVALAKRRVRAGAGGLVNGILRNILRHKARLPVPESGDRADDLGVRFSHPTWMVRRWLDRYGPAETEALLHWNNTRPVYGLRLNTLKHAPADIHEQLDAQEIAWEPSPHLNDFVRVPRLQAVIRAGWLAEGRCAVQDESAGLVVRLLDPQPGETVVDTCAAPGGKALYAALRMQDQGRVLAFDVHAGRLRLAEEAAAVQGVSIVQGEAADLRDLADRAEPPTADRVLLDAPCSGLGVLAKRADLRWQRAAESLDALTTLQDELLDASARLVRPGGLLVYSTCTMEPDENQARIEAFLAGHAGFQVESAEGFVPAAMVTPEGYYATIPHRHGIDGAFGVRLRQQG